MSPLAVVFLTHAFSRARLARPALPTGVRRASALALISSETHSHGLCIIDAHNLAYRMYHALPLLVSKRKEPAHALLGLCNKLWMLRDVFPGYRMLCVFDEGAPTSRIELLPQYKQVRWH
jgi:5'-3' exonuclease